MRKLAAWCALVLVGAVVTRTVVALPEHCGDSSPATIEATARNAVDWFVKNQRPDGTWLYRYDVDAQRDLGGYSWIRHAGALLALEQASAAGYEEARQAADAGRDVIVSRLAPDGDGLAVVDGGVHSAGGTGLLIAALGERRLATGSTADDDRLRTLGRFVAGRVGADGAVDEDGRGERSPFSTGEVMFALARLERLFPGDNWDAPVRRIAAYLATDRAEREGYVPDTSDHWGAYAFTEMEHWPSPSLTERELDFIRKQMGIAGIQVRYEAQRTNGGIDRWTRGRRTRGSGIGTLGEALAGWARVAAAEPALAGQRGWLDDRMSCLAGMLAARQITGSADDRADGAFVQFGVTQMDDQQHPLSALIDITRARSDGALPRRTPVPKSPWLVVVAVMAAMNPPRIGGRRQRARLSAVALGAAVLAALAAVGGPVVRALDVSAPTAVVAAGIAVAAAGLVAIIRRAESDALLPLILRPEVALLAIATGAGGQGWAFTAGLVAAAVLVAVVQRWRPSSAVMQWLVRLAAVVALAAGVAATVDGVFAV